MRGEGAERGTVRAAPFFVLIRTDVNPGTMPGGVATGPKLRHCGRRAKAALADHPDEVGIPLPD